MAASNGWKTLSLFLLSVALGVAVRAQTYVEFSVSSKGYGTRPTAINASGQVVGYYATNDGGRSEGFIRGTNGTIKKRSASGRTELQVMAINTAGEIAGSQRYPSKGFYDFPPNPYVTFAIGPWTLAGGLNDAGYIAGTEGCLRSCGITGFLLSASGQTTTFVVPNEGHDFVVTGMNNSNQIVGYFTDSANVYHGFFYNSGTVTQLDVRGATFTAISGINDNSAVVGGWIDTSNVEHGFIWTQAKGFTSIDYPHATGTGITAINTAGVVVGVFANAKGEWHGFVRSESGKFTVLKPPHASSFASPVAINASGQVTGYYEAGAAGLSHAFVYTP